MLKRLLLLFCLSLGLCMLAAFSATARTVVDMRGKSIELPDRLTRIATIDDGFVEGVLTHLGKIHTVDVIGSWSMKRDYLYAFESDT